MTRDPRRILGAPLLVVLLAALAASALPSPAVGAPQRSTETGSGGPVTAPAQGALLGAWVDLAGHAGQSGVLAREATLGRTFAIDHAYYGWSDPFPGTREPSDARAGRISMISWMPGALAPILDGSQDGVIRTHARALAAYGRPVLLRWGFEMNVDHFPWSGPKNGNDPSLYVAAWRHVHDLFVAEGASNVAWVWSPNSDSHPGLLDLTSWNNWRNYYPGDAYVDWVGIDGYNWGDANGNRWRSLGEIMGPVYADYAARKPIMIAETSSVEGPGGSKAAWITAAGAWIKAHPAIKALVWFDTNQSGTGVDWRIDSSATSLAAFRALAADPYFGGHPDASAGTSPAAGAAPAAPLAPASFVKGVSNPYLPLRPGSQRSFSGTVEGHRARAAIRVAKRTRVVAGVPCVVVRGIVTVDGRLARTDLSWYAQDRSGGVWQLGEAVRRYDARGRVVSTAGSWRAGRAGAQRGLVMAARPRAGQSSMVGGVRLGVASVAGTARIGARTLRHVVVVRSSTGEARLYARGVGLVRWSAPGERFLQAPHR